MKRDEEIFRRLFELTINGWLTKLRPAEIKAFITKAHKVVINYSVVSSHDNKGRLHSYLEQPALIYKRTGYRLNYHHNCFVSIEEKVVY